MEVQSLRISSVFVLWEPSSIYMLQQPRISSIFFCFPEPPILLWLREHGTICPFGVFPCLEVMFRSIWGQSLWWGRLWSCWVFPCFVGISAVYGSCPNAPFVLFDPHHGPFYAPKTSRFKGKMSKFAKNATKLGKTPKGQMLPIYPCLPTFLHFWEPT